MNILTIVRIGIAITGCLIWLRGEISKMRTIDDAYEDHILWDDDEFRSHTYGNYMGWHSFAIPVAIVIILAI